MHTRKQKVFGTLFAVPSHVVRLDDKYTHGWQLRYGDSKFFADGANDGTGAAEALRLATDELLKRIARLPVKTGLRTDVLSRKSNDLPLGISGPKEVRRPNRNVLQYYLQVTFPVEGGRPANKGVYIATENTLSKEKFDNALAKAVALRDEHVRKFKASVTKRKREEAANSAPSAER